MERPYHTIQKKDTQALVQFLTKNGQALLPMVELIEQSQLAVDQLIDVLGRASIEAVLRLSAEGIAGPPHPGKRSAGTEARPARSLCPSESCACTVHGCERNRPAGTGRFPFRPTKPCKKMASSPAGCWRFCCAGVSTRQYKRVLPEMAETVGISKSSVSAEAIAASEEELKKLCERRLVGLEILVIYLDGIRFGGHHVLAAVGRG